MSSVIGKQIKKLRPQGGETIGYQDFARMIHLEMRLGKIVRLLRSGNRGLARSFTSLARRRKQTGLTLAKDGFNGL
jgi:hypothetical protein